MTKSIKIRPYRVLKKDGRHYVKINNKKVYIATHKRRSNKLVGDKQIVRVENNNLMAQRRSYRRRTKKYLIDWQERSTSSTANKWEIYTGES